MKVLAVLFALLVVALSVMPCCVTESCTSEEIMADQTDRQQDQESESCSPFYSCSTCVGFTVSGLSVAPALSPSGYGSKRFAAYKQSVSLTFHHAIWQPPKLG